jgi:alpha-L-rhamnosidase
LLTVTLEDGAKQTVKTDMSWHTSADGPTVSAELYDGEIYDSRLEIDGWSIPSFNDSEWLGVKQLPPLKGMLTPPDGPPMREVQIIEPQRVFQSPSGKTLVDFGQNLVGWLRLNVEGPAGTNITIRHAEVLDDGEIGMRPLRSAKATDTLILSGKGNQTWSPSFTYHGFRFVEVNGWPNSTALNAEHITAVVVHSDMERTGYFECSNKLLNRFHENVIWSMIGNFLSVPTDCPQRDERLGWTGDAHAFMPTSNYLYDASGFWRSWLKDVWSETSTGGLNRVPHIVPTLDPDFLNNGSNQFRRPTAIWGDVIVGNPWALYRTTGDKKMLEEQYIGARAWIDSGILRNEAGLWDRSTFQYADWLDPKAPPDAPGNATTHKHLVADAYLIQMTRLLSYISTALNKPTEASKYAQDREDLISAFHDAWIDPYSNLIANVTQTALALSLQFDIFSGSEYIQAAQTLNSVIANNSYLVGTGFAGTQQLGFALSAINSTSTFYKMLLQTKVPSWLYQVAMNGTTTWERWDSMLPDGSINPGEMTSFNHYSFGSVADWIHQKIGGLAPGEAGWKTVLVAPEPGGNITSANATYLSPYGVARSTWNVTDSGFKLEVQIPPNARADIVLPGGSEKVRVGSGIHNFAMEGYVLPE